MILKFYRIQATVMKSKNNWTTHESLPTFLLDADFLGIISETHAEQIARFILDPFKEHHIACSAVLVEYKDTE